HLGLALLGSPCPAGRAAAGRFDCLFHASSSPQPPDALNPRECRTTRFQEVLPTMRPRIDGIRRPSLIEPSPPQRHRSAHWPRDYDRGARPVAYRHGACVETFIPLTSGPPPPRIPLRRVWRPVRERALG